MKYHDIGRLFIDRFGVRLSPQMCSYVTRRLRAGEPMPDTLAVMGGDARTGVPVRYFAPTVHLTVDEPKPA